MLKVLLDDERTIKGMDIIFRKPSVFWMTYGHTSIFFSKNWELWLDHDLGEGEENGFEFLKTLYEVGLLPNAIVLVSANPVGRKNMRTLLSDCGYGQIWTEEYDEKWVKV